MVCAWLNVSAHRNGQAICARPWPAITGNQTGTSAQLNALGNNGGPTLTHASQAGSPVINTGTNTGCPAQDQRGYNRDGTCDKGAYEYGASAPPPPSTSPVTTTYGRPGGSSLHAGAALIALREITATGNTLYFVHTDHLGSVSAVTCGNSGACPGGFALRAVVGRQYYRPYGGPRGATVSLPTDRAFTGQVRDATGLDYFKARYFSSSLGRFISADSIVPGAGNPQNLNRYTFVLGNPLKYTDPTGHSPCKGHGKCGGGGGSSQGTTPNSSSGGTNSTPQPPFVAFTTSGHVTTAEEYQWATETAKVNRAYARYAVLPTAVHINMGGVSLGAGTLIGGEVAGNVDFVYNFDSQEIGFVSNVQNTYGAIGGFRADGGITPLVVGGGSLVWNATSIQSEQGAYAVATAQGQVELVAGAKASIQVSRALSPDPVTNANPWYLGMSPGLTIGPGNINAVEFSIMGGGGVTSVLWSYRLPWASHKEP